MKKRLFLIITVLVMALSLVSCAEKAPAYDAEKEISVMVLNGTTGFGAAKLIDDSKNGTAALNYKFSVESDASAVNAALSTENL